MNASDVIDDRIVFESRNVQYVACIVPDFDAPDPVKEFDFPGENAYEAWQQGEVYGWYLLRQIVGDDGETIESVAIDSCYGYYGWSELAYMYECATDAAKSDHANREASASHAMHSMDLFDAASYPEPSIDDAIGAFHARLNEGFAAIGECTRKLSPIAIG